MPPLESILSVDSPSATTALGAEKPSEESPGVERPSDDFTLSVEDRTVDFMPAEDMTSSDFMLFVDSPSVTTVLGVERSSEEMTSLVDS
mgnify:FL=1